MIKLPPLDQLKDDSEIWKILGQNCCQVREELGMSREVAMHSIWRYENKSIGNRLVELEKGAKPFSIPLMVKVALVYKTSLDYLLGLSNESNINLGSQSNKMIIQTMSDATIDMANKVSGHLSNMMVDMPKYQGELLNVAAKKMINAVRDANAKNILFKAEYSDILKYTDELEEKSKEIDNLISRCRRYVGLKVLNNNPEVVSVNVEKDKNKPELVQFSKDKDTWKVIANNCKIAREVAGLTKDEAVKKIWGTDNYRKNYKYLVEMEMACRTFSLPVLIQLAMTYECSVDFLVGISPDLDRNDISSQNGIIVQSMRSAALELVDRVGEQLTKMLKHLPNCHCEMLNTLSKKLIGSIQKQQHNYIFKDKHNDLLEIAIELNEQVRIFDTTIARFHRYVEINMIQQIEEYEKVGLRLTDKKNVRC